MSTVLTPVMILFFFFFFSCRCSCSITPLLKVYYIANLTLISCLRWLEAWKKVLKVISCPCRVFFRPRWLPLVKSVIFFFLLFRYSKNCQNRQIYQSGISLLHSFLEVFSVELNIYNLVLNYLMLLLTYESWL